MVAAGEDPRFIARRLIIPASEDVGNADPRAPRSRSRRPPRRPGRAAGGAVRPRPGDDLPRQGPEVEPLGRGLLGGRGGPRACGALPVPMHLRSGPPRAQAVRLRRRLSLPARVRGLRRGQQYLPDALVERRYYLPNDQGYEATIATRMAGRTEAREAARQRGRPERESSPGRRPTQRPAVDHEDPRGEPAQARRDREAGRRLRLTMPTGQPPSRCHRRR